MFLLLLSSIYIASRHYSHTAPLANAGSAQEIGRDTAGTTDPSWPEGYLHHTALHSSQGEGGRKGHLELCSLLLFPSKCYAWWSPAFLEMVKHLCSWEVVTKFCILLSLLSCPYLNTWFFSLLPFQFSCPSHQVWVSERRLTKVN